MFTYNLHTIILKSILGNYRFFFFLLLAEPLFNAFVYFIPFFTIFLHTYVTLAVVSQLIKKKFLLAINILYYDDRTTLPSERFDWCFSNIPEIITALCLLWIRSILHSLGILSLITDNNSTISGNHVFPVIVT